MKNVVDAENVKVFTPAKKLKKKKTKLSRKIFAGMFITSSLYLAMQAVPYIQNRFETNDYVSEHTAQVTQTNNLNDLYNENSYNNDTLDNHDLNNDTQTYAENPYIYEGDVKAFIEAPGIFDQVYPVAQSNDNNYYLNHDINGNEIKTGSIYKDCHNNEGLSDDLTIIYGHNLKDGSNFGKLSDFADKESFLGNNVAQNTFDKNKTIDYKDEYGHYEVDIFASGVYGAEAVCAKVGNFENEEDFNEFISAVINNSDIKTNITPEYGSKIVCFFTCPDQDASDYYRKEGEEKDNRVLVFGVAKQLQKYQELPATQSKHL